MKLRMWWVVIGLVSLASAEAAAGERIAYLARTDSYWQAWVSQPDGSGRRQVTRSPSEKAAISWYPDGRTLLVVELSERLLRVDAETGEERPVEVSLGGVHDASVSPDGGMLALSALAAGERDAHDIWIADADGAHPRRLVSMPDLQHGPRWSRDGKWVYFLSGDGQQDHDIWRVDVATGGREQLTVGTRYHFELDVSRTGQLAFSSNRSGDYEIYTQEPGEPPVAWTASPGLDGHPSWSPGGDAVVFHSTRGGKLDLWVQEGPEAAPRRLTDEAQGARGPEWWGPPQ